MASREFVDQLVHTCRNEGGETSGAVVERARVDLQLWAGMLGEQEGMGYIGEAYAQAKREGVQFPPPIRSSVPSLAIIKTETPPEWTDSAACVRCNVAFSLMLRKHHCRKCGRTFCQDCSGKTIALPELGLYDEVRVCETCYAQKFSDHATYASAGRPDRTACEAKQK